MALTEQNKKEDRATPSAEQSDLPAPGNAGYIELLRDNPNFRNLWFGNLVSAAGDWFNNVALLGLAVQLTGSGLAAGGVLLASTLPYFLLIPIAGPVVDRFSRKKVLIVSNLLGAILALVPLAVREAGTLWIMYLGLGLLVATAAFFQPASQALTPNVVTARQLYSANVLSSSTWAIMVMVGSGLGGVVSATFGRDVVFLLNSLSFVVSTGLIWRVKVEEKITPRSNASASYSTWGNFKAGLVYLRQHPPVMALAACKAGWGIGGGALVLLSFFSLQLFKAGDDGIGLLYAARGLGAMVGPILIRPFVGNAVARMRWAIGLAYGVQAFGYLIFAFSSQSIILVAAFGIFIGHCGGGVAWAGSSILLQQTVPDQFRGRVFAIDLGLSTLTQSFSTVLWSLALEFGFSPVGLALLAVASWFIFGLFWLYLTSLARYRPQNME